MAGFEVIIYGRFWVITEDRVQVRPMRLPRSPRCVVRLSQALMLDANHNSYSDALPSAHQCAN